jgi:hypothetical protein
MVIGSKVRIMARSGRRAMLRPTGRHTVMVVGAGIRPMAGPGFHMRGGAGCPITTVDGFTGATAGAGSRVRFMAEARVMAGTGRRISQYSSDGAAEEMTALIVTDIVTDIAMDAVIGWDGVRSARANHTIAAHIDALSKYCGITDHPGG